MKHKHYYLLLLIVTILLVSCPVNHSSPTPPSKPVAPQEPSAPTADVDGEVLEPEITALKEALSALVHYSGTGVDQGEDQEMRSLRKFLADTDVEIEHTPNNIFVTYYNGSYVSSTTNINNNKTTGLMEISGKYKDSGTSFKVYVNGVSEYIKGGEAGETPSSTFNGTATYTEGSTTYNLDVNKAFGGEQIEDKTSPEYKARLIINGMQFAEYIVNETKSTFTNYNHPSGYIFDGKTVGVEVTNNTDIYDQEKTDGEVSITITDDVQGDVKLIVRYDIKREGESRTITDTSYMHVKRVGDEKFKVFPIEQLILNDTPSSPSDPVDPPVDPTDPVDPPTDPVDPPTDPVDPPVDPADPPVDPADPVDPPVDPTDPVVPDEPSAPTTDVDGNVAENDITAWQEALSALVHYHANGNVNNIYQETTTLSEVLTDTPVEIADTPNNIPVTYYKGSYFSDTMNNKESNKSTGLMEISGKYNDSGKLFKVYLNGMNEYIVDGEAPSSTFTGTATYTEGSTPSKFDAIKAFSGGEIENTNSPEYKARLIMNNMPFAESKNKIKTTFTNYGHTNGYIFDGKTAGVEISRNNTFVSDQEYTNGTVSVTIKDDVQGDVKLIVRYDIKRDATKTITDTSYMHVKKEGYDKFRVFPLDQLTI